MASNPTIDKTTAMTVDDNSILIGVRRHVVPEESSCRHSSTIVPLEVAGSLTRGVVNVTRRSARSKVKVRD